MGFPASLAWRCINGHFIGINTGWAEQASPGIYLLTYTFILNQLQFRAAQAKNSTPAASPAGWGQAIGNLLNFEL